MDVKILKSCIICQMDKSSGVKVKSKVKGIGQSVELGKTVNSSDEVGYSQEEYNVSG